MSIQLALIVLTQVRIVVHTNCHRLVDGIDVFGNAGSFIQTSLYSIDKKDSS